jgi:GH25 family lysozyme M1 (1,4-beta-N-acetylmuramidase)
MFGWFWYLYGKHFKKQKTMKHGIDVSHHQGKIHFDVVASHNDPKIDFAIIKATEGVTYIDPKLKTNSIEAKYAGLKISYYHFASLNTHNVISDATAEAKFFVDTISSLPSPDLPLVLDIETNKASLTPSEVLRWVTTFFKELDNLGKTDYVLYSYTPFLNANLPKGHGLGKVRLWIAAYTNKPKPVLPEGWSKEWLWQYSAKGRMVGIVGDVDMNKFPE